MDTLLGMKVSARGLVRVSAWFSGLFALGLGGAAFLWHSDMALAQAADSLLDAAAAVLLAWVVHVAQTPGDERHPVGHGRAEPLGALAVAALAGILAIEVGTRAIRSLMGEPEALMTWGLLGLFVGKMLFKALIYRAARAGSGAALSALAVDARNDILVSVVAIGGFFGTRAGFSEIDAALAVPAAGWIAWSGVDLARENIDLLLGAAPPPERRKQLLKIAGGTHGIIDAHDLVAHSTGTALSVHVHITVEESLTVRQAHDLGERVRLRLLSEPDVSYCSVHIDPSG